jgi:hypothetical protein
MHMYNYIYIEALYIMRILVCTTMQQNKVAWRKRPCEALKHFQVCGYYY